MLRGVGTPIVRAGRGRKGSTRILAVLVFLRKIYITGWLAHPRLGDIAET